MWDGFSCLPLQLAPPFRAWFWYVFSSRCGSPSVSEKLQRNAFYTIKTKVFTLSTFSDKLDFWCILSLARQGRVSATALWTICTKLFDFCKICVGSIIKFKNDAGRSQNEKIEPWGEQKWARRYQKGAKRIRKRTRREPKDSPKGAKGWLKCINRSTFGTNREKGAKRVASHTWKWEPFWDYLPSKMLLKINAKVDGEKVNKRS